MPLNYYKINLEHGQSLLLQDSKKKVLIFLSEAEKNSTAENFIDKVLLALQINRAQQTESFYIQPQKSYQLTSLLHSDHSICFIFFGINPSSLGIKLQMPLFHFMHFMHHKMIWIEEIATIKDNVDKKKKLWLELKLMFAIE